MKHICSIFIAILITAVSWSQSPEKMSYQAVVRDNQGNLVTNTLIGMQISILQSSVTGTSVYTEQQFPKTNGNGLISIEIGGSEANVVSGSFSTIDWTHGPYFIKTETDLQGGSNYTISGTSQLLSVPYAFYSVRAKQADNVPSNISQLNNDAGYLSAEVDGSVTNELQTLSLAGTVLTISQGNSVDFNTIAETKHNISFPSFALARDPAITTITEVSDGLQWKSTYSGGAYINLMKPSDYKGGNVVLSIFFRTTTSTAGIVDFFIRAYSYNPGEGLIDPSTLSGGSVSVYGTAGFGKVYEEKTTIPPDRLTKEIWRIGIQRGGSASTYHDDVVVFCVTLSY